jgi:glutathione S-transferase
MKIHERAGFPNPARVRIALAEKGIAADIEFVTVDLIGAEHKQPAFLAKNPTGVVPVLELDDGSFIAEVVAITTYLDNLDGKPTLTGTTPREKAVIAMMQKRADDQMIDAIGIYFHYGTGGLGDTLLPYKSPEWVHRQEWAARNLDKFVKGMQYFDAVLRTQPYVAGEVFSIADITVFAALIHAGIAGVAIPAGCTALTAWHEKVARRPSVANRGGQTFEAEDLRRFGL